MKGLSIQRWTETGLDEAMVGKAWAQDGFDCARWVDPPGQEWLDFVHATDERVLVKEGIIEIEVEGARALLTPGDEAFIPAGCRHSVYNRGRTVARWFYGYRRLC
jgi:mannose-6-phosphate isomerase-like protein (cupin superfamily)